MSTSKIIEAKLDEELLATYLQRVGVSAEGSVLERAQRLEQVFLQHTPQKHEGGVCTSIVGCDECEGRFDARLSCCPFCGGNEDENPNEGGALVDLAKAYRESQPKAPEQKLVRAKRKAKAVPELAPLALPEPKVLEGELEEAPRPVTVADLDASVQRVQRLNREAVDKVYELAVEIGRLHDEKLYLQRRSTDGAPLYKSFTAFCEAELPFTREHAYRLIEIAHNFTSSEVRDLGTSRLRLLVQVPENLREELKKDAANMTVAEVRERVTAITQQKADATQRQLFPPPAPVPVEEHTEPEQTAAPALEDGKDASAPPAPASAPEPPAKGGKGKPAPKGKAPKVEPEKNRITVALVEQRTKVRLLMRPAPGKPEKAAKRIADDPWGEEIFPNGVKRKYLIAPNKNGELILTITTIAPQ
jgi:hypothetical protein